MGFRFNKRIRIFPGITLNIGKKGISVSIGVRGLRYTIGTSGHSHSVGVPGTGMSYNKRKTWKTRDKPKAS